MPPAMKPPPWKCGTCHKREVVRAVIPYQAEIEHDGRTYLVTLPDLAVLRCQHCSAIVLDDAANEKISQAFRQEVGLLTPEEIRQGREALGLTQKQLASHLKVAEATLSRWETSAQIQQRSLDQLLRIYFGFPNVRAVLASDPPAWPQSTARPMDGTGADSSHEGI